MTVEGIKSLSDEESVKNIKRYVEEFLNSNKYNQSRPMDGSSTIAYKNHIARITEALQTSKGAEFMAIQAALKSLNPGPIGTGKILNPLTPFGPPPGNIGMVTDSADIGSASQNPGSERSQREDRLKLEALRINQDYKNKEMNLYSDSEKATDNYYVDISGDPTESVNYGMSFEDVLPGIQIAKPDIEKTFEKKNYGFDYGSGEKGYKRFQPKTQARRAVSSTKENERFHFANQDTFFHLDELSNGYILDENINGLGIEDGSNYMPFFLEDTRSNGKKIYFRAFFKNLRESIAPNWTQETYFGRVDPVGIYMGTSRTVSVSFSMVAFSPEGFTVLWKKVNQLAKLLYPTFVDGVMVKSPTSRLRIGDVICDYAGNGLTGYISSPVELDYTDSTWEIQQWTGFQEVRELGKAPQMVTISFTFQVIHEATPKVDADFNFSTDLFRRIGGLKENNIEAFEEDVGEDTTGEDGV